MTTRQSALDTAHLPVEVEIPVKPEETLLPDIYVGLDTNIVAAGDTVVTTQQDSVSGSNLETSLDHLDGQISADALTAWLRLACEEVVQWVGATACLPGEPGTNYHRDAVNERNLDDGYHEMGTCTDDYEEGCIIYDLFGGISDHSGKLLCHPVGFSPFRRQVDVLQGEAEAHHRQISNQVHSYKEDDSSEPLRQADQHTLVSIEGTWKLTMRELKPEFVGLLIEAINLLDDRTDQCPFQIGDFQNSGGNTADVWLLNPLYDEDEVRRMFDHSRDPTPAMKYKYECWRRKLRDPFIEALQARLSLHDSEFGPESGGTRA